MIVQGLDSGVKGALPRKYESLGDVMGHRDGNGVMDTYGCVGDCVQFCKVVGISDPLVIRVAELCERVREALDVSGAVIEEEETHDGNDVGGANTTLSHQLTHQVRPGATHPRQSLKH